MTVKCCVLCFVGKTQVQRVSDIKNYALFRVLHWSFSNQAGCQSTATCETSYCCLFILHVKAVMFGLCQHCSLFFRVQPLMEKVIQTPGFYIYFVFILEFLQGCSETFKAVSSLKEHLQSCAKAISYKCLACGKKYLSLLIIQKHIKHLHVGYMVNIIFQSKNSIIN